jgi:hypothetical protein
MPRTNRPPTGSTLRPLKEGRYLFEIDDVMLDDEYGAIKLRLTIPAGEYQGRRITAHVFPDGEAEFLKAMRLDEPLPDQMKGKFVRASVRRKERRRDRVIVIVVENWERADMPPST